MISQEAILHRQVCDYLKLQHPTVLFRTDFAAGIKMTMGQAAKHKRLQAVRAWPDLFIAEPRYQYHGMFLELKSKNVFLKDGVTLSKNEHVQEQYLILQRLHRLGYLATFAVGFDRAKYLIDKYLSLDSVGKTQIG